MPKPCSQGCTDGVLHGMFECACAKRKRKAALRQAHERPAVGLAVDLSVYLLSELAWLIEKDWGGVGYGAKPYLDAMRTLTRIDQNYGLDSGKEIVLRFLCNAQSWRGPNARLIKAELNRRCKAA